MPYKNLPLPLSIPVISLNICCQGNAVSVQVPHARLLRQRLHHGDRGADRREKTRAGQGDDTATHMERESQVRVCL